VGQALTITLTILQWALIAYAVFSEAFCEVYIARTREFPDGIWHVRLRFFRERRVLGNQLSL